MEIDINVGIQLLNSYLLLLAFEKKKSRVGNDVNVKQD